MRKKNVDCFYKNENLDIILPECGNEEIENNCFYNTNFQIRKFSGNEHFLPTSDPIKVKLKSKKSNIICKYFLKNMCNLYDDCPFFHPYHPEEQYPFNPDILPSPVQKRPNHDQNSKNSHQSQYQNYEDKNRTHNPKKSYSTYRGVHSESYPPLENPKFPTQRHPRDFYISRPKHERPISPLRRYPNSPTKNQPNPYDREYQTYGKNTWNPEKNEPCYYYLKGVCRYGSGCYFYHPLSNTHQPNPPLYH